ncbi:hypothetical protein [Fluviispira multicolorata]|uniref:Uncharacterized protein n=1 Tax=Fluviispira multicolorata TaxID=2654512 RepID=A0A833JDD2_9BACT|nr:hypothetical protein [Fluviispira multicolorata]KAB8031848.1 hypothetical protein GCL57_04180 [Fluviispira multicolorata]
MSLYKKSSDSTFEYFLKKTYPEHARRILQAKSNANIVRFFYPLLSFLIPIVFFACIALTVSFFKKAIISSVQGGKFSDIINDSSIHSSIIIICTVGFILALMSLLIGLLLGFSKAKDLLFHSEQLETSVRQVWLLEQYNKLIANENSSKNYELEN